MTKFLDPVRLGRECEAAAAKALAEPDAAKPMQMTTGLFKMIARQVSAATVHLARRSQAAHQELRAEIAELRRELEKR